MSSYIFRQTDPESTVFYAWFEAMHTRIDMVWCNLMEEESVCLGNKIQEEIKRLEKMANRFDPASELAVINRLASSQPIGISEELGQILQECIGYNQKTFGVFDITIQSNNNDRNRTDHIVFDPDNQTIFFQNADIQLDLSGYIKGYALDKVKELLTAYGCCDALVSIGNSSVFAMGNHPMGSGWKVSTQYTGGALSAENKEVTLYNEFLTTSGNETEERKHIIDPATGHYVTGARAVSVITETGAIGEVLSKTLFIAPKIIPLLRPFRQVFL
ncbi:thiamine biosynthesis lipoprotein [Parabacteroides sp. PFB2-10]|uniref:FAD:protein FMN transferase n=1 Tax=Parabacteroides sp. PFB2-10 TaxID=1742405 RepID=UPI002476A7D6|nr:FAD:protein FMN transferase [Parabacteroides sp. PFB2-10]MDH6313496.1 thiamine biosynthesis lipoprotein [Parabacteroides sp. PFB2-10]